MVISVIERRSEIGLRRARGATRRHITAQFLTESLLLSAMGGIVGGALGAGVTAIYATGQYARTVIPPEAILGGILAALLIGAIAGLYPSMRAAAVAHRSSQKRVTARVTAGLEGRTRASADASMGGSVHSRVALLQ